MRSPNPFHYGTPVRGDLFTGRQTELRAIEARMRDGINVVVTAPRRYGKTSLLERAADDLEGRGASIIRLNVLRCSDLGTLAAQLTSAAYRLRGGRWRRARQGIPEFVRRLRVSPAVTFDESGRPAFAFGPALSAGDAETLVADVYAILAELSLRQPACLMLDEFQAITDLGRQLPRLLKALADEHPSVSLVLAGSKRHLMEELVVHQGAPLYNMAERLALGPIDPLTMAAFVRRRAAEGGKPMALGVAERIIDLAGPVPHDIQRLAYETFDAAREGIVADDVAAGLDQAVAHEAADFAERFARLGIGQRRVLAALAENVRTEQPYTAEFARRVGYAGPPGVRRAVIALEQEEVIEHRSDALVVTDPFFAWWLRRLSDGAGAGGDRP